MQQTDIAVVGAGPAGLAAALAVAESGARTTLLDEYPVLGGQYLAHTDLSPSLPLTPTEALGHELLVRVRESPVAFFGDTLVWALSAADGQLHLALHGPEAPQTLHASAVILATGARERMVPFPGWTLPGVMTVGGAGRLLKSQGVLPGRKVLLAGSGPLLLPVACHLMEAGAQVVAVLEAARRRRWLRLASAVWAQWRKQREGYGYLRNLRKAGVRLRFGHTVTKALGTDAVEAAVISSLDARGRPNPERAETVEVDTICLGFGLVPNEELARLAGCEVRFEPAKGGWVPRTDATLQTSVSGVFVAGEAAGVGGAEAAMLEGRLAGLAAVQWLGKPGTDPAQAQMGKLQRRRRRHLRFGAVVNELFAPKPDMQALAGDETVVCRCEEVTAGQIRSAIAGGVNDLQAVKTWCRAGQGQCQGRTCGPVIRDMVSRETPIAKGKIGPFTARPPLKPVPLSTLTLHRTAHAFPTPVQPEGSKTSAAPSINTHVKADVVVVGGGIVGAACSYYLCEAGLRVHLVERSFPAAGSSSACDGLILLWDKQPGPELQLGQASAILWNELSESLEFDFDYVRKGTVMLAESEEALAAGQKTAETMADAGVRSEFLDGRGLLDLEPNLADDLAGGFFFPDDAQLDPRLATLALLNGAKRRGLVAHLGSELTGIEQTPRGVVTGVITSAGEIATEHVVNAAGVWSGPIAEMVGATLPVRPRKGHVLVTEKASGLVHRPVMEGAYVTTVESADESLQVAMVAEPTAKGTLLLGSSRQFAGFDRSTVPEVMAAIGARATRFVPKLAGVQIIRSYAGLRPWSPDHLPFIGPMRRVPGFWVATGHEGAGICLAPITGHLIAQLLVGQEPPLVASAVLPGRA